MTFATGSRAEISYITEVTYGVTPGTPTMLELRSAGANINVVKEAFSSDEIRADRQIEDLRHGVKQVSGDISFELSYGAFDDFLESALFGSWSTNILKAGTALKSFTMERRFLDIAQYHVYTGCVVNTASFSIQPNGMVTGTFGIIGKTGSISSTSLDSSPTAAASNPPFDGFTGSINEGGSAIASITGLQLNLSNGISPSFVIGSDSTPQLIPGRSDLTGTVTAYFEDASLLTKFLAETESSIDVTIQGASGGDLLIDVPRIKYTGGEIPVTSGDEAIILSLPFQALRDTTEATNLKITRTPA